LTIASHQLLFDREQKLVVDQYSVFVNSIINSPAEIQAMSTMLKADAGGAVLLPAELCRAAGVEPGADLVADVQAGRIVLAAARPPFWERIAALTADIPPEELDKLPIDGAAQIDHYLYGTPKRPE
jgi:antitoxin component of MazEF toxin-antitoxin module